LFRCAFKESKNEFNIQKGCLKKEKRKEKETPVWQAKA
jgi:hypothetical protein